MVDSYSGWGEVETMRSTTADGTINTLRKWFSRYGLPTQLVSDNGPQFTSYKFENFCKQNGIKHVRVPAYHQSSNGEAERFVQTVKKGLKRSDIEKGDSQAKLDNFLLAHRTTPTTSTGKTPSELFLGRTIKSRLDLIKPSEKGNSKIERSNDIKQKRYVFPENKSIFVRNHARNGLKWIPAKIVKAVGSRCYEVLVNGITKVVHVDQIIKNETYMSMDEVQDECDVCIDLPGITPDTTGTDGPMEDPNNIERRYPLRIRTPVDRYGIS